jgi:hypothetical protein
MSLGHTKIGIIQSKQMQRVALSWVKIARYAYFKSPKSLDTILNCIRAGVSSIVEVRKFLVTSVEVYRLSATCRHTADTRLFHRKKGYA